MRAAVDGSGNRPSDFSSVNSGWRKLSPPTGVTASDGAFADKVRIAWNASSGATHYMVYRNIVNDPDSATALLAWWTTELSFDDTTAQAGQTYYYWVRAAINNQGGRPSDFSQPDTGYRAGQDDCPEDLNGDGVVDLADLAQLLSCYGIDDCGDVDGDGDTDQADMAALLAKYGKPCS